VIEPSDSDDDADTDDRTDDGICDAGYADDDGNDYDDIVDGDYVDDDVDDDDHDDTGDVDADACAEYDAVDADVGVDRHLGEVEPVADADGVRDVQRGFESAANGWLRSVAALDTVYDRTTCNFATIDCFFSVFLFTYRFDVLHELEERLLPGIVLVCCANAHELMPVGTRP
jgi:hypothetical protein